MDDLLDLSWSAPSSSSSSNVIKQPSQKPEKPRDVFADLLFTTPKPVDISKLSLIERQALQQQQQSPRNSSSPWLTPIRATTPTSSSGYTHSSTSISQVKQAPATSTSSSSFENLLDPFGSSIKKQNKDNSTPLSQLRTHTSTPVPKGEWDLDFLDTKLNDNTNNASTLTPAIIDSFDMDYLMQQAKSPHSSNSAVRELEEDDNPLGILAGPALKLPQPVETSEPEVFLPKPPLRSSSRALSPVYPVGGIMLDEDQENAMLVDLIEMGFSLQESKFAIEATNGQNLQSAVDLLIQSSETAQRYQPTTTAPACAKQPISQNERARNSLFSNDDDEPYVSPSRRSQPQPQPQPKPTQKHQEASKEPHDDLLHETTEKIVTQAQELGGFLYKNATSYFKAGREKVNKAVGDWQEQQRSQRLQHMQEEQNGTVRPKWMQGGDETLDISNKSVERFADDDDSEDEGRDLEAEQRKLQEMNREQAAAAHKQRQQQKLRKDALIDDEQATYVSPSRRRGNSGRSTPSSNASPQLEQQRQTPSAPKNSRSRPIVNASPDVMARANDARRQGNEKFKLGQFGESEEAYTRAIEILPAEHDHQVLLYNNRAMARLKIGHYKKCVEDCDIALGLAKQSGEASTTCEGVVIQWRAQIIKLLSRKAEALENIEKYKDALATYDELLKYEGGGSPKVNQSMSRCRQALKTPGALQKSAPPPPSQPTEAKQDFMSMFDHNSSSADTPTASDAELSKSKAVAAIRAKAAEQEAEDAEKLEKTDDVNARLLAWKAGKEHNLRALLATVDTLLWPGAQWKGAQISELINPKTCKITYMKAISKVHPDKLPSDVTVEQRMLANGIFASLNEAWDSFKNLELK